jgi:hypothetical protein
MWFKVNDECFVPKADVVGFFQPVAVDADGGDKAKSVALLRDGGLIFSTSGPKTLQKRYEEGKI